LAMAAIQKLTFFADQEKCDKLLEQFPVKLKPFGGVLQKSEEIEIPEPSVEQKDPESRKRKSPRTRAGRSKLPKN
jgi:hypothetical protein